MEGAETIRSFRRPEARHTGYDVLLATGVSRTLKLPQPIPVYVIYITAEAADDDTGQVTVYPDIYRRDGR